MDHLGLCETEVDVEPEGQKENQIVPGLEAQSVAHGQAVEISEVDPGRSEETLAAQGLKLDREADDRGVGGDLVAMTMLPAIMDQALSTKQYGLKNEMSVDITPW